MGMILQAALLLYTHCSVCIEYLDYSLEMFFKRHVNILMLNLIIRMSSSERVAQNQIYGIPCFLNFMACETIGGGEQPHQNAGGLHHYK